MSGPRTDPGLAARCQRNYIEGFWQVIRGVPGARRRSLGPPGNAELLGCDLHVSAANVVFLGEAGASVDVLLDQAVAVFGVRPVWRLISTGTELPEVARAAAARGLRRAPAEPGMILDPIPELPRPPPGLAVRTVCSPEELREWSVPWCGAFRIPRTVFALLFPGPPADDPERHVHVRLAVGYSGGRPVACSATYVSDGIAGVFSVGTLPEERGKGYGRALTVRAVEEGRGLGATTAFLAATPMGYPVYERLGFRRIDAYPSWEVPMGPVRTLRLLLELPGLRRRARGAR